VLASAQKAAGDSPKQWRNYFWIAVGGEIVFIPLIWLLTGFWSPKRAKKAEETTSFLGKGRAREVAGVGRFGGNEGLDGRSLRNHTALVPRLPPGPVHASLRPPQTLVSLGYGVNKLDSIASMRSRVDSFRDLGWGVAPPSLAPRRRRRANDGPHERFQQLRRHGGERRPGRERG